MRWRRIRKRIAGWFLIINAEFRMFRCFSCKKNTALGFNRNATDIRQNNSEIGTSSNRVQFWRHISNLQPHCTATTCWWHLKAYHKIWISSTGKTEHTLAVRFATDAPAAYLYDLLHSKLKTLRLRLTFQTTNIWCCFYHKTCAFLNTSAKIWFANCKSLVFLFIL